MHQSQLKEGSRCSCIQYTSFCRQFWLTDTHIQGMSSLFILTAVLLVITANFFFILFLIEQLNQLKSLQLSVVACWMICNYCSQSYENNKYQKAGCQWFKVGGLYFCIAFFIFIGVYSILGLLKFFIEELRKNRRSIVRVESRSVRSNDSDYEQDIGVNDGL